jgi:hypothetical protein
MKSIAYFLLILAVILPVSASAETVLRIGENISVQADQVVDGDYYVSVGPLGNTTMSGSVTEDMYAFGGSITVNGPVGKDLTVIGGTTQVHATVTDDVRIVAGEVTVAEHIEGDLFVLAGMLTVLSSATVDGDIIFFGGEADINGKVGGSILGTSERLRVNAEVGGDIDVKTVAPLTLGEQTVVAGSVTYTSREQLSRAPNAVVEGEVVKNQIQDEPKEVHYKDALIPVFISLFAALSLYLLFRKELVDLSQLIYNRPLKSGLFGLLAVILGPVVSLILIATILGMLVGIAGLALVLWGYVLGFALSGVVLGAILAKLLTRKLQVSLMWILIGTFALHACLFIPVVGVLFVVFMFALTVGGLTLTFYKSLV